MEGWSIHAALRVVLWLFTWANIGLPGTSGFTAKSMTMIAPSRSRSDRQLRRDGVIRVGGVGACGSIGQVIFRRAEAGTGEQKDLYPALRATLSRWCLALTIMSRSIRSRCGQVAAAVQQLVNNYTPQSQAVEGSQPTEVRATLRDNAPP